jgi:DNA-binding response OmpR family regulator
MEQNAIYTFGPFLLETNTQLLRYKNESIRLQPKVYRVLLYFLQHPGVGNPRKASALIAKVPFHAKAHLLTKDVLSR